MPGTHYVLRGDEYDVRIQDASEATMRRRRLLSTTKQRRMQKGRIYPGARATRPPPLRIV